MKRRQRHSTRAFTLIEILIVIAIIGLLASFIYVMINPTKQLGRGRDTQRQTDVNTIMNAVYQYAVDNNNLPPGIPKGTPEVICKSGAGSCRNGVDLSVLTLNGKYLTAIPSDPQAPATGTGTNYTIMKDSNSRLVVTAPGAEQSSVISVTR